MTRIPYEYNSFKKSIHHTYTHSHTHYYNKIYQYYSKMNSNGLNTDKNYFLWACVTNISPPGP